jgi:hypothetical protein
MAKPKHRRCGAPGCGVVTSRYSHTERAGAFVLKVWVRDPTHGEVTSVNGTVVRCKAHAEPVNA